MTAIREAATDGNPDTEADPNWSSFITTPNHPSYTAAHGTLSGASGAVLADFFGTDNITFTASTEGFVVPDRTFTSISQASTEASNSRLYGGIHWSFDNEDGLAGGRLLGHRMLRRLSASSPRVETLRETKAAGESQPRRRTLTGPAPLGARFRAEAMSLHSSADHKERSHVVPELLQSLTSTPTRRRPSAEVRRLASPVALKPLEDRRMLSFSPAASFPVGTVPRRW